MTNKRIERFIDELFDVFTLAEDTDNIESVEPAIRELVQDLIYEERLRAVNILEVSGQKLDRETQMNLLGGYNA